ncbi:hypothetical protein M426DRAFT_320754 [Hypoxylon sp. CI-4A]|nr:hypothetical protein M426DRAFT_320754 [Hypoxylon sp. CI-4A]
MANPAPGFLGGTRIQRRLVKIPNDQRKLLDRRESWAGVLSGHPGRFLNVPPDVLENLKNCHARQHPTTPTQGPSTPQHLESNNNRHKEPSDEDSNGSDNGDNTITQAIDWTPSPPEHMHPPQNEDSENGDLEDDEQEFLTQAPPISSPRPTVSISAKRRLPPLPLLSSQDQEELLDIEVPTGANDVVASPAKKRSTQSFATPPSAQIVPCTFDVMELSPQTKAKQQPRRYNQPGEFLRKLNNRPTSAPLQAGASRVGHADVSVVDLQSSASMDNSSSIIPSTVPPEALRKAQPGSNGDEVTSSSKESGTSHVSHEVQESPQARRQSPVYKPQSSQLRSSPPLLPTRVQLPPTTKTHAALFETPYSRYKRTYPSYNGSVIDFVIACMYIQIKQDSIRPFLYDDFIRAWSEEYIPYVNECDKSNPPMKALGATRWYNTLDDDPRFTAKVITKQNLKSTLDYYPNEVASAQTLLGPAPILSQEPTSTPIATRLVKGHAQHSKENVDLRTTMLKKNPVILKSEPEEHSPSAMHMPPLPKPLGSEGGEVLPLHKSMSEIEARPTTSRPFKRSVSDASHFKRQGSDDLDQPNPKRFSLNSLTKSKVESRATSVGSETAGRLPRGSIPASPASSSASKKRKNLKNPRMSVENWEKFIRDNKRRQLESIASSMPSSNVPTSAQKE